MAETVPASTRRAAYPVEPREREQHTAIIRTDDPKYLPSASAAQVEKIMEAVCELRDDFRSVAGQLPRTRRQAQTATQTPDEARFSELVEAWRAALPRLATVLEMATHPAYQQIVGMGQKAVPLILAELSKRPDHWFWALKAITGEDPVDDADRGDIGRMTQAWLIWGARNGYDF